MSGVVRHCVGCGARRARCLCGDPAQSPQSHRVRPLDVYQWHVICRLFCSDDRPAVCGGLGIVWVFRALWMGIFDLYDRTLDRPSTPSRTSPCGLFTLGFCVIIPFPPLRLPTACSLFARAGADTLLGTYSGVSRQVSCRTSSTC